MRTSWKLLAIGVLAAGQAWASEAETQDPPGGVGVDQPAGVSLEDRHSERDASDTLRGGATDVIEGERARPAGGAIVKPSRTRAAVEQGSDARASFDGTGSSGPGGDQGSTEATEDTGSDATQSTFLGTDIGYGTGTEPEPTSPER